VATRFASPMGLVYFPFHLESAERANKERSTQFFIETPQSL